MTDTSAPEVFGPGHREWCPNAPGDDPGHCSHWYDCEPCHRCGDDTPDPGCDCVRCWAARTIRPGRFVDQTVLDEEAGDLPLSAELLLEELHEWAADHGEVDEWWCEQLSSVPSQVADPFITNPSITTANGLRAAVAAEISYVMAGTMLDVHELARTADGKVLLDGVQIGEWTPKVTCCRACEGTPIGEHGQRLRHPTCGTCGSADCPRATAHLNTLCQGVDNR